MIQFLILCIIREIKELGYQTRLLHKKNNRSEKKKHLETIGNGVVKAIGQNLYATVTLHLHDRSSTKNDLNFDQ